MKILAWILLVCYVIYLVLLPWAIGRDRKPWSYNDFIRGLLEFSIVLPICGRILGWW